MADLSEHEILARLYNHCNPLEPATKEFYIDCTDVRGGAVFAENLCTELAQTTGRIHTLFTGHVGCGKSSELQHLVDKLAHHTPLPNHKRFFAIRVDMLEYIDEFDVTPTEILLSVISELSDELRKREGIELKDTYLQKRWEELRRYFLSDAEINEGEIVHPWAKVKVQRMRTSPEARQQIRDKLRPQTTGLLTEINNLFVEVRLRLKQATPRDGGQKYSDFILVLDNLEKIQRLAGHADGEPSRKALFIENAPLFTSLDAHIVYTVPLSLVRETGGELGNVFARAPFTLPMVKTEQHDINHSPYDPGRKRLTELLARRAGVDVALANVFEPAALEFLLTYSGGHVRNLLMFVREATIYANGALPITLRAAQRAVGQTVNVLSPSLQPTDWKALAALEVSEGEEWNNNDPTCRRLLEMLCVMEYINGGDEDIFNKPAPWYAVNPIVRELNPFKRAVAAAVAAAVARQASAASAE